jgi:hypothetical protein
MKPSRMAPLGSAFGDTRKTQKPRTTAGLGSKPCG